MTVFTQRLLVTMGRLGLMACYGSISAALICLLVFGNPILALAAVPIAVVVVVVFGPLVLVTIGKGPLHPGLEIGALFSFVVPWLLHTPDPISAMVAAVGSGVFFAVAVSLMQSRVRGGG